MPMPQDPSTFPGINNVYPYGVTNLAPVDFAQVSDGTSNTAVFSEKLIGLNGYIVVYAGTFPNSKRVSYQTGFTTDVNGNPASIGTGGPAMALSFLQTCKGISGTTAPTNPTQWSGSCWSGSHAGTLHFNAYNHWNTPNGLSCVAGNSWGGAPGGLTISSRRPATIPAV